MSEYGNLYKKGLIAFEFGDVVLAVRLLNQAIETGDAGPEVFADLGVFNRELKNLSNGISIITIRHKVTLL